MPSDPQLPTDAGGLEPMKPYTAEQHAANRIAGMILASGKPGPGGIDITGGIPSSIYIGIGRDRYDGEHGEYELAEDTAATVRRDLIQWICDEFKVPEPPEEPAP